MSSIKTITGGHTHPDGTSLGSATTDKVSLFGLTPIVQPSGAAQGALTDSTGGSTANFTLAAVGATNGSDVSATINANFAKLAKLVDAMRTASVNLGVIKGSA